MLGFAPHKNANVFRENNTGGAEQNKWVGASRKRGLGTRKAISSKASIKAPVGFSSNPFQTSLFQPNPFPTNSLQAVAFAAGQFQFGQEIPDNDMNIGTANDADNDQFKDEEVEDVKEDDLVDTEVSEDEEDSQKKLSVQDKNALTYIRRLRKFVLVLRVLPIYEHIGFGH